jgi:hypothetical protein
MSWKRKANMPLIIEALRSQTVPVDIWLINNGGSEDFGAGKLIQFSQQKGEGYREPWSPGEWARYVIAGAVQTEYCMFQDDDYKLGDKHYLEDAIELHSMRCPDHILGVAGRGIQDEYPYYWPDITDQNGRAAIVKGHFQLFKTGIVRRARIPNRPTASDILWSLDTANGEARHYVSQKLSSRLDPLPNYGVGYEFRPGHMAERNQVCKEWLAEREREYV